MRTSISSPVLMCVLSHRSNPFTNSHILKQPPGEGNGNPCQCSCLENPMDRGAWWATVQELATRVRHDLETKPPTTTKAKQSPAWLPLLSLPGWMLRPSPHPLVHSDLFKHTISPSWLICKHFLPSTGEADALFLIFLSPQDLWAVQGLFISSTRPHRHPCSVVLMSRLSTFLEPRDLSSLSSMIFLKFI